MTMVSLHGKRIVVLGASGLLGAVAVEALLASGADVVGAARRRTRLDSLRSNLQDHERLRVAEVDVTDQDGLSAFANDVEEGGGADGVLHAVGSFFLGAPWELQASELTALFDLNALSPARALHAFVPGMLRRGRGSVVLVGANTHFRADPSLGAYGASKAAVAHLVEASACCLEGTGVRINGLFPGAIAAEGVVGVAPLSLAKAAAYLLSDDAAQVHGTLMAFDGAA